jgi:hypothetical protein
MREGKEAKVKKAWIEVVISDEEFPVRNNDRHKMKRKKS